ncbi:COMM domain-containing protein 8 [Strongylocentrotus purpuratus]|uniref:COMM domain-containing protein n=1 Tax=Strongylocentrotus purpuratus TaxID=7668 RepID=A0A7M7RCS8_STRPU|nr:COMM domain-containing protein 8 [Strongylocentrotus purpuratus]|eukprot:XP_789228.1 PREDICTED: COMM domain-containing protein 8 [Strongylocentrotus purpuratus]
MATPIEDLGLLSKCSTADMEKLLHQVADSVAGHHRPRYQDYGKIWSLDEWFQVIQGCETYLKMAVKKDSTKDEMKAALSGLSEDVQERLMECVSIRRDDLGKALIGNTASISQSHLTDFDWKLKLAMSSDKISSVQEPLVNLDLSLMEDGTNRLVSLELDKEELRKLVSSLETANRAVLQLKT